MNRFAAMCSTEAHCGTCRDLEGGRAWRQSIVEHFEVHNVDFSCPHGHKWGDHFPAATKKVKSRGLGDTVAKVIQKATGGRVKPCGGCKKRQQKLNELVPYRG